MKALLLSDIHSSYRVLSAISEYKRSNNFDLLVFAGDLVDMGEPVSFVEEFFWTIEESNVPVFWIPGNNDFGRAYYKLNAKYKSLEGRIFTFAGHNFTGVGGSPASWAGQYQGERSVDKKVIAGTIFVSHVPPPGLANFQKFDQANPKIQDTSNKQIQNNNNQNTDVIARSGFATKQSDNRSNYKEIATPSQKGEWLAMTKSSHPLKLSDAPLVHICGHIHHTWGIGYLGSTKVIKLAGAYLGYYAIMDLEHLHVDFERFWK